MQVEGEVTFKMFARTCCSFGNKATDMAQKVATRYYNGVLFFHCSYFSTLCFTAMACFNYDCLEQVCFLQSLGGELTQGVL